MMGKSKAPRPARVGRRNILMRAATLAIFSVLASEAGAASACTARFPFCDNCSRRISIVTKKNTPCYITYTMRGGTIFSQTVIKFGSGIYGTAGTLAGAYKPKPGFVGKDAFVVEIQYSRGAERLVTTLRAFVDVRE